MNDLFLKGVGAFFGGFVVLDKPLTLVPASLLLLGMFFTAVHLFNTGQRLRKKPLLTLKRKRNGKR